MSTGYTELSERYGGDAYTGIQNAAAQTANNIRYLAEIIQIGLGGILLIAGLLIILHYIKNIITTLATEKAEKNTTDVINEPAKDDSQAIPMDGQSIENVEESNTTIIEQEN